MRNSLPWSHLLVGRVGGALSLRDSRFEPTIVSSKYLGYTLSSSSSSSFNPSYFLLEDRKSSRKSKLKREGFSFWCLLDLVGGSDIGGFESVLSHLITSLAQYNFGLSKSRWGGDQPNIASLSLSFSFSRPPFLTSNKTSPSCLHTPSSTNHCTSPSIPIHHSSLAHGKN